jgi:hypothetical protein
VLCVELVQISRRLAARYASLTGALGDMTTLGASGVPTNRPGVLGADELGPFVGLLPVTGW